MNKIDWSTFDGYKFQEFCNLLFSFEIAKDYTPFNAPGADSGIDGLYNGTYSGKTGKWRFQAKFHHPHTGRAAGFKQLVSEIKKDITSNINDEDFLVLVTNIEINPNQKKKLEETVSQINAKVNFNIWDGAKLQALLARHPLVLLWYTENYKIWLQDYKEYYKEQFEDENRLSYNLGNKFYYRAEDIKTLTNFVEDNTKSILLVTGEAGIGKTRLCIEYFKNYLPTNENWIPLVIVSHQLNIEKIAKGLMGENNYLVLIDDAEKFESRDISDLIQIIKSSETNKVKFLFTTRKYFSVDLFQDLKFHENSQVVSLQLQGFSSAQVVEILKTELANYSGVNAQLNSLAQLTYGKPIMVMTLIDAVKNGKPFNVITKNDFLFDYVKDYFSQFVLKTSQENEIAKKTINEFILTLALIEPIDPNDENLIQLLSKNIDLERIEILKLFEIFINNKILTGYNEHSIKPDLYSDIILRDGLNVTGWVKQTTDLYPKYINNIIKNLSCLTDPKGDQDLKFLETLFNGYIDQLENVSTTWELTSILDTVSCIAYDKPEFGILCVEKFINILDVNSHPLHSSLNKGLNEKNYSHDPIIKSIGSILSEVSLRDNYCDKVFSIIIILNRHFEVDGLIPTIFGFSKIDHIVNYTVKRQSAFITIIEKEKILTNIETFNFALKAVDEMLKLEFNGFESSPFKSHQVIFTTYYVSENSYIKELRKNVINLLCSSFISTDNKEIQDKLLEVILKITSTICSTKNKNKYKGKEEIEIVFKFFKKISLQNLDLAQKHLIKEKLYWYKKWGIDKSFYTSIDIITNNLTKDDLAEKLLNLFNPKFEEYSAIEGNATKLVSNNSAIDIADSLVRIIKENNNNIPHYLFNFLQILAKHDKEKAKTLTDSIWSKNPEIVINYLSVVFSVLYFDHSEFDYVRDYFKLFQKKNNPIANNSILHIYNPYRLKNDIAARSKLSEFDFDLIKAIIDKKNDSSQHFVTICLPVLLIIDKVKASEIISSYLLTCNSKEMEQLFSILDFYRDEFYSEIKNISLSSTHQFHIPHYLENVLNNIIKIDGFNIVFEYIKKRVLHRRDLVKQDGKNWGYEIVPHDTGNILNGVDDSFKNEIFFKVLDWYIDFEFDSYELLFSKNILKYFLPSGIFTKEIAGHYKEIISKNLTEYRALRIAKSLAAFEHKNELYGELILHIIEECNRTFQNKTTFDKIKREFYISFTSLGVKSGTVGEPFPVDIELKEILLRLKRTEWSVETQVFLNGVLESVQRDIDENIKEKRTNEW